MGNVAIDESDRDGAVEISHPAVRYESPCSIIPSAKRFVVCSIQHPDVGSTPYLRGEGSEATLTVDSQSKQHPYISGVKRTFIPVGNTRCDSAMQGERYRTF